MKLEFSRQSKNTQISNFMKILQVGAELFHAGGPTDTFDEADCGFSNSANAPNKCFQRRTSLSLNSNLSKVIHTNSNNKIVGLADSKLCNVIDNHNQKKSSCTLSSNILS
jgi:hypothetical protein